MLKTFIHNDWQEVLGPEFEKPYYTELHNFLKNEYKTQYIHPDMYHIYEAFEWTPFSKVKVVILGQDPYHGVGQAQGLAFSTPSNIKNPPSMQNILKEIESDLRRKSV